MYRFINSTVIVKRPYHNSNFLFNLQNTVSMRKHKIPSDILNVYANHHNKKRITHTPKKYPSNKPLPPHLKKSKKSKKNNKYVAPYDNIDEYYNAYCI